MSLIPLRLGALGEPGYVVQRSGIRWLCDEGHVCRAGEVIAYCNIGLRWVGPAAEVLAPFRQEERDFQVALAPRCGGRLIKAPQTSLGGFLDRHDQYHVWSPDFVIGHVQCRPSERPPDYDADGGLRLLMLAGRRATELAEVRSGLLTGWHDRSRAWWADGDARIGTVLSLGVCEQAGIVRGEQSAFLEMFEAVTGPAQVMFVPDDSLVPCARVIVEQMSRDPAQSAAIAADMAASLVSGQVALTPADWMFAGALLSALEKSPCTEPCDLFTRWGLRRSAMPDAIVLSLSAEAPWILRHRRLGYTVNCHSFRVAEAGAAVRRWLETQFEPVARTPDAIADDYRQLIDALRSRGHPQVLVMNVMSTVGSENIHAYAAFDQPLRDTLASVRGKELNLMLHGLAREKDVRIVDIDAIAADIGAGAHLPDGIHSSGAMQSEVRAELLRILAACKVPGFTARAAG